MKKEEKWIENYKLALLYYLKNGNLEIPVNYKIMLDNGKVVRLGNWIHNQRGFYKRDKLSKSRTELLELIGMSWDMNIDNGFISSKWMEMYNVAKDYYIKHGNLNVSKSFIYNYDGKEYKLGHWLMYQRRCNSNRDDYKINKKQIRLLNKLGVIWNYNNDEISPKWMFMFELAKKYFEENSGYNIRYDYKKFIDGKEYNLGLWYARQRYLYRSNHLTIKQIELLESIGTVWNLKDEDEISLKLSL